MSPSSWRSRKPDTHSKGFSEDSNIGLPLISLATMTGIRTFIGGQGRTNIEGSRAVVFAEDEEIWPLANQRR